VSAGTAQLDRKVPNSPNHAIRQPARLLPARSTPAPAPVAVSAWLRTVTARARGSAAGAPATLLLLFAFTVTWWTLRGADSSTVDALLVSASTNLDNLTRDPVQVLVASAFWSDSTSFPWTVVAEFLLVLVAAERWLGSLRWTAAFIAGHVGATLIVAAGLSWAVQHELLPDTLAGTVDVGTSYGFWAVAALLTYRFAGWQRVIWAATVITILSVTAWQQHTFTDVGHLTAMAIGFSLYPLSRRPNARIAAADAECVRGLRAQKLLGAS
jgi:hypothetical protein